MFNGITEQLGHMADIYRQDATEPGSYTPINNDLWESQRSILSKAIPILKHAVSRDTGYNC